MHTDQDLIVADHGLRDILDSEYLRTAVLIYYCSFHLDEHKVNTMVFT